MPQIFETILFASDTACTYSVKLFTLRKTTENFLRHSIKVQSKFLHLEDFDTKVREKVTWKLRENKRHNKVAKNFCFLFLDENNWLFPFVLSDIFALSHWCVAWIISYPINNNLSLSQVTLLLVISKISVRRNTFAIKTFIAKLKRTANLKKFLFPNEFLKG